MRLLLLTSVVFFAANSAFAFKPVAEREFADIAASGCSNRDCDFLVRGMVSNANENTLYEASAERLNELRTARSLVVVTLECKGNGTPVARDISYTNSDGTRESISF